MARNYHESSPRAGDTRVRHVQPLHEVRDHVVTSISSIGEKNGREIFRRDQIARQAQRWLPTSVNRRGIFRRSGAGKHAHCRGRFDK